MGKHGQEKHLNLDIFHFISHKDPQKINSKLIFYRQNKNLNTFKKTLLSDTYLGRCHYDKGFCENQITIFAKRSNVYV